MNINISLEIEKVIQYALNKKLIEEADVVYTRNRLLEVLQLDEIEEVAISKDNVDIDKTLENIMEWALAKGILKNDGIVMKDLFDTKIMGCVMPRPSEVINKFNELYKNSSKEATDYFYELSKSSNYIRVKRVNKDLKWKTSTEYGDIDITINLSKPEKDPKAIAMAKNMPSSSYPKCLLCKENEGYSGRINHPARQNHRIIPLSLSGEKWWFQYSPYVYYNEHCIVFKNEHEPMKISRKTFERLLDFIEQYPHYFLGSNADLPIVGGSILTHDHFQGGNYEFAMAKAPIEEYFEVKGFEDVKVGRVAWPMSVIRIQGRSKYRLVELSDYILNKWRVYSDEKIGVLAFTGEVPHNTITPIARKRGDLFELDLVLRNNRTSAEYPEGIFHPHEELHHIKKENIGLIEVMGLAVLPARLKDELRSLSQYLLREDKNNALNELKNHGELSKHYEWAIELLGKYSSGELSANVDAIIEKEVGLKFSKVLEHAGVFKRNKEGIEAFGKFLKSI